VPFSLMTMQQYEATRLGNTDTGAFEDQVLILTWESYLATGVSISSNIVTRVLRPPG